MTRNIIAAVAAFAVTAIAVPGIAQAADPNTAAVTAPAKPSSDSVKPRKATKYCVRFDETGSRIKRQRCQTREEWIAEGFDPLKDGE